jgi:hypothetical protein
MEDAVCVAVVLGCILTFSACGVAQRGATPGQPDRVNGSLPPPASQPATADEWARLTRQLDDARAENQRKDATLAAAIKAREAANFDTWKRFGVYSYALTALGIGLLVLSILPWTAAFLGSMRPVALLLIGGGVLFGLLPHILATYGPVAFYPLAIIVAGYVLSIAALDIWRRIRRARAEAGLCVAALDPARPEVGLREVIEHRAAANPLLDRELLKISK